jgi:hypothetical protein
MVPAISGILAPLSKISHCMIFNTFLLTVLFTTSCIIIYLSSLALSWIVIFFDFFSRVFWYWNAIYLMLHHTFIVEATFSSKNGLIWILTCTLKDVSAAVVYFKESAGYYMAFALNMILYNFVMHILVTIKWKAIKMVIFRLFVTRVAPTNNMGIGTRRLVLPTTAPLSFIVSQKSIFIRWVLACAFSWVVRLYHAGKHYYDQQNAYFHLIYLL